MTIPVRIRHAMVIAAMALGLGLAGQAMSAPAHAQAVVPGSQIAPAATGPQHACEVIGSDSHGNQAVICTNVISLPQGDGEFLSDVQSTAYCQNAGQKVQCANITLVNESAYQTSTTNTSEATDNECGHSFGACPQGGISLNGDPVPADGDATCIANTWGVTLSSGLGLTTAIQLPTSDMIVPLKANFASPHTSIGNCPA
jgi:hypothetical protein